MNTTKSRLINCESFDDETKEKTEHTVIFKQKKRVFFYTLKLPGA